MWHPTPYKFQSFGRMVALNNWFLWIFFLSVIPGVRTPIIISFMFYAPLIAAFVLYYTPTMQVKIWGEDPEDIGGPKNETLYNKRMIITVFFINFSALLLALTCVLPQVHEGRTVEFNFGNWNGHGNIDFVFSAALNPQTVSMFILVHLITICIILYSLEYMSSDPRVIGFLVLLSMFNFSMNVFVLSANLFQIFLGWESVGLISYLLIKHYDTRVTANKYAIKAIVVNKVGDIFFMAGMSAFYDCYQTFDIITIRELVQIEFETGVRHHTSPLGFDIMCICFVLAAATKSASFTLHTWLPDAMEGPTPVSALLHAATMVTVGVFWVIRIYPIISYSTVAMSLLIFLGCASCLFAGTVAFFQSDIKRIIAFSTCGQLGYMMFACGIAGPEFAMFHLINHSFFKALLFLSAGAVIHALMDEQDIRKMGGLINLLPFSYFCMFVGSIALIGTPFLTGFYSKEGILALSYSGSSALNFSIYLLGLLAAILSILYSLRLLFFTFFTAPNAFRQNILNLHEAPLLMAIPMFFLLCGSIFFGFFTQDFFVGAGTNLLGFALTGNQEINSFRTDFEFIPAYIKLTPIILMCFFLFLYGMSYFNSRLGLNIFVSPVSKIVYYFMNQRWLIDFIYARIFVLPTLYVGEYVTTTVIDRGILELCGPYGLAHSVQYFVSLTRKSHSGYISVYLAYILLGVLLIFSVEVYNFGFREIEMFLVSMCTYSFIRKFTFNLS